MTNRPALRELIKISEKWRNLAEKRRDYFSELDRSDRWEFYYDQHQLRAQIREAAEICDRWKKVIEDLWRAVSVLEAPAIDRDAA